MPEVDAVTTMRPPPLARSAGATARMPSATARTLTSSARSKSSMREIEQATTHRHSRVEDRCIEPAESFGGGGHRGIVRVDRGHVADDGVDVRCVLGLGGPCQGIGETIDGDDGRAVCHHPFDGGTPDPRRCAGDDGDAVADEFGAHGFM